MIAPRALVLLVQLMHANASDYPGNAFGRMEGEVVSLTDGQNTGAAMEARHENWNAGARMCKSKCELFN